jgi:hypothetical protein
MAQIALAKICKISSDHDHRLVVLPEARAMNLSEHASPKRSPPLIHEGARR